MPLEKYTPEKGEPALGGTGPALSTRSSGDGGGDADRVANFDASMKSPD